MKRWLLLSPMIGVIAGLAAGLAAAFASGNDGGVAIAVGAVITGLTAGGVNVVQRTTGREALARFEANERRARLDSLTGLMNRAGLMEAMNDAIEQAERDQTCVGVLFSDLDRFKVINDTLGHEAGDELLVAVAGRMEAAVRSSDVVARFGGDEFVVLCLGLLEPDSITRVAEAILDSFAEPFPLAGGALAVSPSIGVAVWDPSEGETVQADHLIRDADTAMYEAKRRRSGVSVFDYEIRRRLVSRLEIERSLNAADTNELVVHYQPIFHAAMGATSGVEALVRWDHPEHGILYPGQFLSVAEESGQLATIGENVLREACAQAAEWNHLDPSCEGLSMSVNVAECQVLDASFPTRVRKALEWAQLPPHQLCLEISEDLITEHISGSLPVLQQIADLGVRLSLDDFGTGRTTLSHLKHLGTIVHQIKIDRVFVTNITTDPVDRAVVEAVSRISRTAGLVVIAEGVETLAQAEALEQLGIHHHQGFLYSRGLSAEKMTDRLQDPDSDFTPPRPQLSAPLFRAPAFREMDTSSSPPGDAAVTGSPVSA